MGIMDIVMIPIALLSFGKTIGTFSQLFSFNFQIFQILRHFIRFTGRALNRVIELIDGRRNLLHCTTLFLTVHYNFTHQVSRFLYLRN